MSCLQRRSASCKARLSIFTMSSLFEMSAGRHNVAEIAYGHATHTVFALPQESTLSHQQKSHNLLVTIVLVNRVEFNP